MIFVVAIDPESIRSCAASGEFGADHLIGILLALQQNCLLAEICGTWRISEELKQAVKSIPDQNTRKKASAILEDILSPSRYRLVEVIRGFEDDYDTLIGKILSSQTSNENLDVIICETDGDHGNIEFSKIGRFNQSNFARIRSQRACALIHAPGTEMAENVLKTAFGRLIAHSDSISIYDRVMGKDFGDNYFHALGHWCRFFRQSERKLAVRFHTTQGQERRIRTKLSNELEDSGVSFDVIGHDEGEQPHERFLRACGFTLDIGRGIDLFDKSGQCRDVKIGLSDHGAFTRDWRHLGD